MIDAGSSGSRVHVYRFNYCQQEPQLEDEVLFHMLKPGLSSYKDDPMAAARSLNELMDLAVENVPTELHHCTPIAVKATAGLRLLGKDVSDKILAQVRSHLETNYPFPIAGENGIQIMDGSDEGVYAWITVNYLLGKLQPSQRGNSAAVFDLGGASTQIVFEPVFPTTLEKMVDGDHKYQLDYGKGEPYSLYQHSYLGFGLNEARKHVKEAMISLWHDEAIKTGRVYHPCLPLNHTETIAYTSTNHSEPINIQLIGTGAGSTQCRAVVEKLFGKDLPCATSPCAFNGVYQPSLVDTFKLRDLYVFSYFFDLTQPMGMPLEFSVMELGTLTRHVCDGDITDLVKHVPNALETLRSEPDYCLDLTYAYSLLKTGYDLPPERLVRTAQKIHGVETGWCLGASIAMIDSFGLCKA
ncbi:nucleoside phosphatase GDA1/CD39 [Halteromyces radiatus]|uniref:nucleoside phosphatase GDA1/CD39 n=1 Tax=Halteromyces radiatus TaxID=101107 RepID=UPI00221F096A|nr:nucleoside phosphatase GDA1/CD39 [Halteromyces radiatus]KAI8089969.1 nucleoside phosphatase GDA1/CD39 [Halteromyces radiatus]